MYTYKCSCPNKVIHRPVSEVYWSADPNENQNKWNLLVRGIKNWKPREIYFRMNEIYICEKHFTCAFQLNREVTLMSDAGSITMSVTGHYSSVTTWLRHQMETFSALLAICVGNSPFRGEFPTQRPVTRSFDVFFDLFPINGWVNNREAGDLRRTHAHYDVIVIM